MDTRKLIDTAKALVAGDKGLLAMDESTPTCDKRFAKLGIPQTVEARRAYREMIVTTPGLGECISGAILFDETIRQQTRDGTPFVKVLTDAGIIPGIKVDAGAKAMAGHPGEKITEGLDGLRERLTEYARMGARFAKWRAVIAVGEDIPSWGCMDANAHALARYASLCQEAGIVPVVEPEVLMDGEHSLERCREVTEETLNRVFDQLYTQGVLLEGMLLKPNMVLPGLTCSKQETVDEIADATVNCLLRTVPAAVPGIAFLSGGQSGELASARLNAMNVRFRTRLPWAVAFSFARAIQQPALEIWSGNQEANVAAAQKALVHRAECNRAARRGEYSAATESLQRMMTTSLRVYFIRHGATDWTVSGRVHWRNRRCRLYLSTRRNRGGAGTRTRGCGRFRNIVRARADESVATRSADVRTRRAWGCGRDRPGSERMEQRRLRRTHRHRHRSRVAPRLESLPRRRSHRVRRHVDRSPDA